MLPQPRTLVHGALAVLAWALLEGCATVHPPTSASRVQAEVAGSAGGFFTQEADTFQRLQEACGLREDERHPAGAALSPEQMRRLWASLVKTPVTQRTFGPRLVLSWLLREALLQGGRVGSAEWVRRLERFRFLVVVRPDGYLVTASTGEPLQRLGHVEFDAGEWKVGRLVVGTFYSSRGGVLYPVDEALQRQKTTPWAELGLERDWLNAALEGAQDAIGELSVALARSVLHPIRSAEGLQQLPTTVARLIASSPEYFARFGDMSLQDQIREAARLSTHLLMLYGGAGTVGSVGQSGGLGATLPALSVTAEGLLEMRAVAVAAGTVTTTVEVGGAIAILHMTSGSWGPPTGGPGRWVPDTSSMSEEARAYQAQVTGAPKGWAYRVCRDGDDCVDYDGYDPKEDRLLEAKGVGYDQWFNADLNPRFNFKGLESLVNQARRQSRFSEGARVRWYVAEPRMVAILQKLFKFFHIEGIEVVYKSQLR